MTLIAAADGSALGNPGPAGWAWYIDEDSWRAGGWDHGTNNMGELTAVLDLLRATRRVAGEPLTVLCDSQYVINSLTKWLPGWKKKGWKKRDGKPVLNVDIMKALDRELAGRRVTFEWVKGHAGHELNEAADRKARAMACAYQAGHAPQDLPAGPGFPAADAPGGAPVLLPDEASGAALRGRRTGGPAPEQPDLPFELAAEPKEPGNPAAARGGRCARGLFDRETTVLAAGVHGPRGQELLDEDFEYIAQDGAVHGTERFVADRAAACTGRTTDFEVVPGSVLELGPRALHLSYRLLDASAVSHRSSVWVREDQHHEMGPWLLRYHQVTAER